MSQRGKRPNSSGIDNGSIPVKRRKGRPPTNASYIDNTDDGGKCVPSTSSGGGGQSGGGAIWQPRPGVDIKMSSIYNRSAPEAPAELFRKDLISAMKLPDSEPLSHDEYWVITDQWKQEWERGVQVPVNPDSLPEPVVKQLHENYYKGRQDFKLPKNKYIRITKDENFSHDKNYLSNTPALADSVCSYDLDQMDEAWLKVFNGERSQCGLPAVNEEQFERIIEELEIRCHDKIQAIMKSEEGLGIEYDENVICDVCRSPDSEEANEMVFCDNCNICVHQACYGITMIPSGQWLCRTCSMGQKPDCVLCPNKGGAMKSTRSGQKWAHVSCALWIPEVSIGSVDRMEPITKISSIPSSRWQLLCVLCREKVGACIQCSVKTCKTAYHVTCAFQHGLEMRAIIEDENAEDGVKLRSYCQKHSVNNKSKKEPKATNNEKGSGSEEEDKTSKKRIRKDMTSEERSQVRVQRSLEIEAEFDKHVSIKDISCHLLDVDQEGINHIYNYWILKRKAGGNRPLLLPKSDDVDVQSQNQEQADFEKMKMFVHLRQDLERVRNLCYMVSRRQKLSRSYIKMREQIFHKQISILSKTRHTEKLDETCLNAICEANHGPSIYDVLYSSDTISANIKQMPIDVMIDAILGNNNINNNNNNNNSKNKLNINKSTGAVSSGNDINIGTTNNNSNNNNKKSTQDRYKLFNGSTKRRNSNVIDSMSTSDSDTTSRSVREARRKRKERSHRNTSDVSSISSSSSQSASTTSEDDESHPRQRSPAHSITAPKDSKKKVRSPIKSHTSTESTSRRGRKPNAANFNNNNKNKYSFDSSSEDDSIHVVPKSRSSAKMPQQHTQKSPRSMTLKQMEQELDHTNLSDESDELIDIKNSSGYSIPTGNSKRVSTTAIYSDTDSSTDKDNKTDNTQSDSQQQPFRTKAAMKEFNIEEFNKLKKSPGLPLKSSSSSIPSTSKQDVKDKDKYLPPPIPINSLNDVSSDKQSSKDKSNAQNKSTKNISKDFITDLLVVPQREAAKKASENLMRGNASLTSQSVSGVKNEVDKPRKVDKFDEIVEKEKVRPVSSHDADKFEKREERHDKESKKSKSVKENKRPGRPSTNDKRQKEKELQQQKEKELQREKEQKEKEEREKREFSELMAQYVPQRQAAKKAAEHIKSGLVKTTETAPTSAIVGKEVEEKPVKPSSSTPSTQNAPKRREERKPTLNLSGSSSDSSSSSGSSGSSSSSSSESDTESPKKTTQDQKVPQKQLAISKTAGKQPTTISSSTVTAAASVKSKTKDSPFLDKVAKPSADHTSSSSSSDGSSDSSSSECDSSPGLSPKARSPVKSRRQSTVGSPTKKSSQQAITSKKQSQSGGTTSKKDNENTNKSIPKVSTPKSEFETGLDTTKSGSNKTPIRTDTKSQISSPHQTAASSAKASPSTLVPNKLSSNKSRTSEPSKGDLVKLPDKRKSVDLKDHELPPPAKPVTETTKEFTEPPRRGRKPSVTSPPPKVAPEKSDTESKPMPMQRRGSRAESQMQLQKEKERLEKEQKENERKLQLQKEKEKEKEKQLQKEKEEKEKREKEQREKEQREKERLEKEQKEKERKLQLQKEKEEKEKERLQKEKEEKEKQRQLQLQKEKEQKEKEKREKEQKEKERLEKERLEKERLEKERLEKEQKEKERREKEEKEKREKEQKAKEEEEKRKQAEKLQRDKIQAESEKNRKDKPLLPNADNATKKISNDNEKDVICIDEGEDMDIDESINQSSLIVENLFQKDYIKSHVEHVDTEKTSYDLTNFTRTTTVNATTITETVKPNKNVLIHESPQESASKTQDLIETLRRKRTGGKGSDVTLPDTNANNNSVMPENNSKEMNFNYPAGVKGKQNENFIAGFPNKNELRLFEMSPQEVVMSAKSIDIRNWSSNKKEQQIKKSPYGMGLQNENDNQNTNYAMNRDSSIIAPGNKNLMDATNVKPIISDCMVEQQQLQMQQKQQLAACQKAGEENLMNRTNTSNMFMSPPQLQPIPNRACGENIVLSEKLQQMHALSSLENSHMLPGNKQTGMMGSDINMMNDNQNCMKNKEHMQQFSADMSQQQQAQQQQQQQGINEFGAMHAGMHGGLQTNFNSFNNFGENHYPSAVSLFPPNMNVPTALPSPGQAMFAPNFNNFSSSSTHPQNTNDHPMMMLPKSDEMQQQMNNNQMNYNMPMCQQGSLVPPFSTQLPPTQIMQTDMSKNMSPFTESNNKIDLRSSCEKTPKSHESKKSPSKLVRASPRFSNQNFDEQQNSANSTPVQSNRTPQKSPSKSPRQPVDPFVKQSSNKAAAKAQNEKGKKSRNNSAASTPPSNSSSSGNNRGKGRGRGRGRVATPFLPMPNEFDYPQKLAGTVYDFNDDDLSHPNVENFRAMRDRQKSIEYYNKIHRDVASESPKFSLGMNSSGKSPFMKSTTTSSNLTPSTSLTINNHTLPNSLVNDASSINQQSATASSLADVNPVLPGPVDMRTYSSYDSNEAYNSQLLGAFASNTVDQQLQEIDEEMEKELHSALKASSSKPEDLKNSNDTTTTTITSILSVAEQNVEESVDSDTSFAKASLSDSRNQLKLKIKGPLANPEQHSSSSHQQQNNVQSNILPIPIPVMLNPSIGTTGSTNQRRMRKKELLRQYCAQDMNMEEQSNPQSTDLPATNNEPIQSTNRTTGFPRAVDSMSLLSTKDDYKDYANTDYKKRRKLTMSRELRQLTDKLSDPMTTSNLLHNSANPDSDMTNELNSKRRFRQRNQQQQEQQSELPQQQLQQKQAPNLSGYPPKLKIKIGNSDYIETMGASDLSGRPPKKRILPSNQTSYQDYKRESMNFRKKMFGEFNEKKEKHHRSKEEKRMRKEEKRKKKKEKKGSIEIISNVGENSEAPPKLIIRFGNKPATSTTTSPQSNSNINNNNNNNNSASNNNSTANTTAAAPTDTSGNVTVTPIRLKIARNSEGSGYCLSTKNNPPKDKKEKKEKDPSTKNKKKSKDKEKKSEDKVKVKEKDKEEKEKKKDKEKEEVKEKEKESDKEKEKIKENEKEKEKENIEEKSKGKEKNPVNTTIESSASTTTIVTSTPKSSVSMLPPIIDTVDISNLKTKKLEVALERLSWNNPSFSNMSDIKIPSQTSGAKKQRANEESPSLESILKTNKVDRSSINTPSISNVSDVKTPSQTAGAKKQIATEESPSNTATPTTNPNSSNKKPINNPSTEDCEVR